MEAKAREGQGTQGQLGREVQGRLGREAQGGPGREDQGGPGKVKSGSPERERARKGCLGPLIRWDLASLAYTCPKQVKTNACKRQVKMHENGQ